MRVAGLLLIAIALAVPAQADEAIHLSVMLIEATKTGGDVQIDESLAPIAAKLRKAYPEYQRFALKSGDTQEVTTSGSVTVDDADTQSRATATYQRKDGNRYRIAARTWLKNRQVHQTVLRSASGQVGFLTAFLDKEHNRALITAVLPAKAD